jgi:ferredoxin
MSTPPTSFTVELDEQACSLCEVCARECPTGALRLERSAETLGLIFAPGLCNGCPQGDSCQEICPEKAIVVRQTAQPHVDEEPRVLLESRMVRCAYCGEPFAPLHKIEAIEKKGQAKHDLCPLCRRTHLVVSFIEERRAPGEKAEYRSAMDIIRRAGYDLIKQRK